MTQKIITATLIVDWKSGAIKVQKRKPTKSKIKPSEIPIELKLKINTPEAKVYKAEGEMTISESKFNDI